MVIVPDTASRCTGSFIFLFFLICSLMFAGLPGEIGAKAVATFSDVSSIFQARCTVCHSGEGAPLGLRLNSYENLMKGSERGPVVKAGDPEGSELVRRIRGLSQPRMPLTGPPYLSDAEISMIEDWVKSGAKDVPGPGSKVPDKTSGIGNAEPVTPPRDPGPGTRDSRRETRDYKGLPLWKNVEPIFLKRCVKCHAEMGKMGPAPEGLRLDTRDRVLRGGERVVVVPGSPGASELVRRINGYALPRMPFDGPPYLSEEEIELVTDWVYRGAMDDGGVKAPVPVGRRVRLHGTLSGQNELDGFTFKVTGATRVKKRVGPGDYVEVRGVVTEEGGIRASRVRRR